MLFSEYSNLGCSDTTLGDTYSGDS